MTQYAWINQSRAGFTANLFTSFKNVGVDKSKNWNLQMITSLHLPILKILQKIKNIVNPIRIRMFQMKD